MRRLMPLLVGLVVLAGAGDAFAQTGPALLFKPWENGARVEVDASAALFGSGRTDAPGDDDDVDLQIYQSAGRVRLNEEKASPFAAGYELFYLNIDSNDDALPNRLVDQQVAVAAELFHCDGWAIAVIAGAGYASSNPFDDSRALYGRGDIVATRRLDEQSTLQVGLNYDGNRLFLPDIPLPGIAYSRKVSDTLSYTVGVPYSTVYWIPADRWYLRGSVSLTFDLNAELGFEIAEGVTIFGAFRSDMRAFHIDGDDDKRRVFFEQTLAEIGLRWRPCPTCEIFVTGGLAFDQEFTRGWDVRDTDDVRELSDEPFVRVGGRLRF